MNIDDLIEKGLLMTKEMQEKMLGQLPYSRHQSMPSANFGKVIYSLELFLSCLLKVFKSSLRIFVVSKILHLCCDEL